ncbi:MAG: hypothetical protein QOC61_1387 [Acidobacteriota bacterium]|jgi:hypothetical protein|nr:hypothetical protein [Acidobacteriota bacterium]MDT5262383.1 hypothetical protein [Acidobacteriota bacterium]MDT7777624.1 hypothetical protein [Acidobacteriota bacterium]
MALTGQLSDMSLAELIEFFCNQRKTGRLKIDYQRGHSVFFIKEGELVDAKVGALSGSEAVYFSLTLPNAAFDFSPDVLSSRRTINDTWTQVVLEGLRRLDEGLSPTEADAFGAWSPSESELAQMLDQVEHLDAAKQKIDAGKQQKKTQAVRAAATASREEPPQEDSSSEPFSMMVESAASSGSKKKFMVAGVAAALVLGCAVAAVPLLNRPAKSEAAHAAAAASTTNAAPAQSSDAAGETAPGVAASGETPEAATPETADASVAAADAARREALDRERRERKRKADEAAKKDGATAADATVADSTAAKPLTPTPAAPSGPKSVRVTVNYDEAGRVTQASVAGVTPGAEAYGSTAVRMARGKHFPAGKAGSTVITIPVN